MYINCIKKQCFRVMRITTFLMLLGLLQVSAKSSAQLISLSGKNMPLMEVLKTIHQQSDYDFIFMVSAMDEAHPVNVDFRDLPLKEALAKVFADQPLGYAIEEGAVTVWMKKTHRGHTPTSNSTWSTGNKATPEGLVLAYAEVRGRVVDSVGQPLVGASVRVLNAAGKRTALQTKTDREGYFELKNVPEDAMLEVTFIGYEQRTINASSTLKTVVLQQVKSTLDETIVQAYGTTTRRLNTGNIAKVSASEIERQPVTNPLAALQGRIPGMLVTQTSGIPGGAVNIEIRGRTAIDQNITSDQPLFVIDGVPYSNGNESLAMGLWSAAVPNAQVQTLVKGGISPFQGINPQDIESIEVLKDADATAIYGSRGANGVILITTKRGTPNKATLSLNTYHGVSFVASDVQMMNTSQYLQARKKAFQNSGREMTSSNAPDILVWDTTLNYNYADMFIKNVASTNNTQLSYAGGNTLTRFSLRGGYLRENTVMDTDHKNERINVSFSLDQKSANEKFNVLFSGSFGSNINRMINQDMSRFRILAPNMRMIDEQGNPIWEEYNYATFNPFAERLKRNTLSSKTVYANIQPNYRFSEHLKASMNVGYNLSINDQQAIVPVSSLNPTSSLEATRGQARSDSENWSLEPQLDYQHGLLGGRLNVLLGGTFHATSGSTLRIDASGFPSDESLRRLNNALNINVNESSSHYKYLAVFGRLNYNLQNTFLLNITARRDGSSRFGPNKRFSNFGALGMGWIFSNTIDFSNTLPWISFGKIRGSIGFTGNDKIPDYQYLDTWAVNNNFRYPQLSTQFLYPDKLFNPEYHWESTRKTEVALEIGLFNDRVMFSPVYFLNSSENQLVNYQLPRMTGFNNVIANLPATVINAGFEFTLSSSNVERKDFSWQTDFNLSVPRNKLKAFPDIENSSYYTTYVVGQPLNVIYTYDFTGVDPETGNPTFRDVNQDGTINTDDYVPSGTLDPKFYGGLQNTVIYKNFQLDFFFQFRKTIGGNYLRFNPQGQGDYHNWPIVDTKVWEKPGDIAKLPKLIAVNTTEHNNFRKSNAIYSDASYLQLNNASLSYRIPGAVTERWGISTLRIYVLGQNLWTITGYEVGDPTIQSYLSTPPLRTITGGFQLIF